MNKTKQWIVIFFLYTIIGLLNTLIISTDSLANYDAIHEYTFFYEMTGAYCALIVLPLILFFVRKFPIKKDNARRTVLLHILFAICTGVLHTFLMWGTRIFLFALFDWGVYDYGIMKYRFIMECAKHFTVYWIIYSIVILFNYMKEIQTRKIQTSRLQEQLTNARLQALQMQLNPHFLFNTLNMISSVMYEDVSKADSMITRLSDLLRKTLNGGSKKLELFSEELEKIKLYVEIMSARFLDNLQVKYEIKKSENLLNVLVPPFILQPIVENSIVHSQENLNKIVKIKITAKLENSF
ncbi:MAG: sensor histidine kinase, partial [Rhodothermaceae bacterium]